MIKKILSFLFALALITSPFSGTVGGVASGSSIRVISVTGATMEHVFDGLQPGRYAVAIIHDENSNKRLDTNFMGIPKEGYGVSNNIVNMFGPPGFDESSFSLKDGVFTTEIKVNY